jgi:hypothetical protein
MTAQREEQVNWRVDLGKFWNGVININENVNRSTFGRVFRLKGSGHVSGPRQRTEPNDVG